MEAESAANDIVFSDSDLSLLNEDTPPLEIIQEAMEVDNMYVVSDKGCYIIVDTSILISDLKFLDQLKDQTLQGCGPTNLVIPWVVIAELDSLKRNRFLSRSCPGWESQKKAVKAIKYIYVMLRKKHPRFRGQTLKEAQQPVPCDNDDKILQCCLQLCEKVSKQQVVLLCNDKNLLHKALVSSIQAHTRGSFEKTFKVDFSVPTIIKTTIRTAENEASEILKKTEMKESWQETEIHPMPWTLIQILKYIQSHWNTVFGFIFTRDVKSIIDKLVNELKDSQGNICEKKNALNFFSSAISLSYCIQRIYGSTSASIERLKQLRKHCHSLSVDQICMNTQLEVQLIDSRPLCTESQQKRVFEMFRYVWEVINHVSGMLLDSLDFLHNLQYNRPNPVPNREEAMDFLPRFFPKLKTLKRQMQSVVQSSSSSDLQYKESVSQLFNSLIHFVPQLEVQLNTPTPDTITIEMMELYCGNPNNRECLASGYDELVQFYGLVHQCIMNTDGTSDLN